MTPTNRAAWITAPKATPLEVKQAPYPIAGATELIVQVQAVAINPLEYKIQDTNPSIGGKTIQYPTILGADLAGVVVSVGSSVTQRRTGDRIIANGSGHGSASAAFQQYVVVPEQSVIPVPDDISLEAAVVLPLACDTAAAGLFMQLGLSTTQLAQPQPQSLAREVVLVWGGSSSVGCCAIQLACAAGYNVYTTASRRNHDLCSSLGASRVFDHTQPSIEAEIIAALHGKKVMGALDCVADAEKTIPACVRILADIDGERKVVTVLTPPEEAIGDTVVVQRCSEHPSLMGTVTYDRVHAFMAGALQDGRLQPKPEANVVGQGLGSIQHGIDVLRRGVSAQKIVVRI
ncbi:hypothetical protein AMS68_005063 [Peltaster fructicola]|uniref:Enoyl reductase (ER) domain-containing protein n=1 Tax=Peltaster fructicola TaxID=286661 RepID=A0A6H0XXZ2_9PEZI|nr:hypothetical protein AMS68_005063 [Peltaster fructicola]